MVKGVPRKCESWNSKSEIKKSKIQAKNILKVMKKVLLKLRRHSL